MPPKAMRKGAILDLVKDLLAKANKTKIKSKKKITEWGDESEEDDDSQTGETSDRGKDPKMEKEQKVLLDAFKSLNKDNMEHMPYYSGSLNGEELLDWLEAIDNQFDYKEVQEEKRVSYAKARLKGSILIWWNMMQDDMVILGKKKIVSWERIKIRLRAQFLSIDYEIHIYQRLKNLRKMNLTVSAYTKEFKKLSLRVRRQEEEVERVARYLNGLR